MVTTQDVPLYIGGQDHSGGAPLARENPARCAEQVGTVRAATPDDAGDAVAAAASAAAGWAAAGPADRAARLVAAWQFTDDQRAALATLLTTELGKGLADTAGELAYGIEYARFVAERAAAELADRVDDAADGRFVFRSIPYGVVVAIIPWNAPLNISSTVVAPALAAGNTVVVKPSPLAPLAVTNYLRAIAERLPAGVLNVVNGDGDVGAALVGDPRVGKVAFTGSTEVGRHILRSAADAITPSLLELGGNDAAIVLADADLSEATVARMVFGSFLTGGQVCMAIKRLLVHRSRHDELVDAYLSVAREVLLVGDPCDPRTTMGPLVSRRQVHHVSSLVDTARRSGAAVHEIGSVTDPDFDLEQGYFLTPTLVVGADREAPIVTDEQFGPTVPILPFTDVDDAVALANSSEFGLCASVWTGDEEQAFRLGPRLEAGTVFVNTHNRSGMSLRAPFGGVKHSGYGREYGIEGLHEFVQTQTISHLERTRRATTTKAGREYAVR